MQAIKGLIPRGTVVVLPNVPHPFLREAPLVDGDWIDSYIVDLAEWSSRLAEKGYFPEEPDDNHPMAWQRITDQEDASEVDAAVTMKIRQQTGKHLARFPGRTKAIGGRRYLNFEDYLRWRGRRNKGDLKSGMRPGLPVSRWNRWVDGRGGEEVATLAGVKVGKLVCYLDGYRYRICQDAGELAEQMSLRESLLQSLQLSKPPSGDEERFRLRVEHWKESALWFLPELYILRGAINSISQRYFDGQRALFPAVTEGFDQLLASGEKLVDIYNEALAGDIERLETLLVETVDGPDESPLTIDLASLIESALGAASKQVAYMVDMAKSDALDLLGESRQAFELVDRYV